MMPFYGGVFFLANGIETTTIDSIIYKLKENNLIGNEPMKYLNKGEANNDNNSIQKSVNYNETVFEVLTYTNYGKTITSIYMSLYRKFCNISKANQTLLSYDDQIIALQLCILEYQKKINSENDINLSDLKFVINKIKTKKLFNEALKDEFSSNILDLYENYLNRCNMLDSFDLLVNMRNLLNDNCKQLRDSLNDTCIILLENPKNCVENEMLKLLIQNFKKFKLNVEIPLNASFCEESLNNIVLSCNPLDEKEQQNIFQFSENVSSSHINIQPNELHMRETFMSYLELVINTRNELALARAINIPERNFDHNGFTILKHNANDIGMSLYQTAVSFVMKTRLGGKSYAPDDKNQLINYLHALSDFTDFIHKLHTILEDEQCSKNAIKLVIKTIKSSILKCKKCPISKEKLTIICDNMLNSFDFCQTNTQKAEYNVSNTMQYLQAILDRYSSRPQKDLLQVIQGSVSRSTPLRLCNVICKFQSPDEIENKNTEEVIVEEETCSHVELPESKCKSFLDWAPVNSLQFNSKITSQTNLQNCSKNVVNVNLNAIYENDFEANKENFIPKDSVSPDKKKIKTKKVKRNISSSLNSVDNKKKKQPKRKPLQQISGQQQLTSFFTSR